MKKTSLLLVTVLIVFGFQLQHLTAAFFQLRVVGILPTPNIEDKKVFSQGLVFFKNQDSADGSMDSFLYHSGGLYGKSIIIQYQLNSKNNPKNYQKNKLKLIKAVDLDKVTFAEGITVWQDKIYQLTWKAEKLLVYDLNLNSITHHNYQGEGWGLTLNGEYFIRSDGSDALYLHRKNDFSLVRKISVSENGKPIKNLNALQFVAGDVEGDEPGKIYANVWYQDYLVVIDQKSGKVEARVDGRELVKREFINKKRTQADVLNGIAYDATQKIFYLTGKNWNHIYQVEIKKINKK